LGDTAGDINISVSIFTSSGKYSKPNRQPAPRYVPAGKFSRSETVQMLDDLLRNQLGFFVIALKGQKRPNTGSFLSSRMSQHPVKAPSTIPWFSKRSICLSPAIPGKCRKYGLAGHQPPSHRNQPSNPLK